MCAAVDSSLLLEPLGGSFRSRRIRQDGIGSDGVQGCAEGPRECLESALDDVVGVGASHLADRQSAAEGLDEALEESYLLKYVCPNSIYLTF